MREVGDYHVHIMDRPVVKKLRYSLHENGWTALNFASEDSPKPHVSRAMSGRHWISASELIPGPISLYDRRQRSYSGFGDVEIGTGNLKLNDGENRGVTFSAMF